MNYNLACLCASEYSFSDQQKQFIKAQFRYATKLKAKLDAGEITQEYYDKNVWLATQQLESPNAGWRDEFINAVASEDLNWLANTVGESLSSVTSYVGKTTGAVVGGAIGGVASGISENLGLPGWVMMLGIGAIAWWAFTKGPLSKFKL